MSSNININIDLVELQSIKKAVSNLSVLTGQQAAQSDIVNRINNLVKGYGVNLDNFRT